MSITSYHLLVSITAVAFHIQASGAPEPIDRKVVIDGSHMRAFTVAYQDFLAISDLSNKKKDLNNYTIHFHDDLSDIEILFVPKLPPGWFGAGGETPLGRSVHYYLQKKTYKIIRKTFGE